MNFMGALGSNHSFCGGHNFIWGNFSGGYGGSPTHPYLFSLFQFDVMSAESGVWPARGFLPELKVFSPANKEFLFLELRDIYSILYTEGVAAQRTSAI